MERDFAESIIDDDATTLDLAQLREVRFCSLALGLKLHLMPASSLVVLELSQVPLPNLPQILERHHETLRKLWFDDIAAYTDPAPFHQLKLRSFHCHYLQQVDIAVHEPFLFGLLEHQTQLRVLKISEVWSGDSFEISPRIVRNICTKTELKKLMMNFSRAVTATDIFEIRNLKKLEQLEIDMFGNFYHGDLHEEISVRNEMIVQTICNSGLLELTDIHMETYIGRLSLNMFLDNFPKLKKLMLHEDVFSFTPGRIYSNMVTLWLSGYAMDLMPCFIKSMPNLQEIYFESLYPRVSTVREIAKINATKMMFITVRLVEGLSSHKEKKLRKISEKFKQKRKAQNLRGSIHFREANF